MRDKPPPSAVSLFTAVGLLIILVIGLVGLIARHAAPGYWVVWCLVLLAGVGFNAWAWFGNRRS
jgi:hypothetical protein